MPLHLVGETIDKTRSHYAAESGKLIKLNTAGGSGASSTPTLTVVTNWTAGLKK